jgi:Zn-dependent protease
MVDGASGVKARTLLLAAWGAWEAGALLRFHDSLRMARAVTEPLDLWLAALPTWGLALAFLALCALWLATLALLVRSMLHGARVAREIARRRRIGEGLRNLLRR